MIKLITSEIFRHKYRLAIFAILSMATVLEVLLVRLRMTFSGTGRYAFLIWNLFLAWIPFGIAYVTYTMILSRKLLYVIIPVSAFLWLIFFPNAPYIVTDLQHLRQGAPEAPLWYDVIMLIWFAWTGLLLGLISLYLMQGIVRREFGRIAGWGLVFTVASLSSVGMYIGRFIHWNSWDILRNPLGIAASLWNYAIDPSLRSIGFISLYTLFFIFIYATLYAFGHLLQERPDKVV